MPPNASTSRPLRRSQQAARFDLCWRTQAWFIADVGQRGDAGGVAVEALHLTAGVDVPEADGFVVAAGDQAFAVGGESKALDRAGMPAEFADFLAAHVVETNGEPAGGGELVGNGCEGEAADFLRMLRQPANDLPGLGVPVNERAVLGPGGDVSAIGSETDGADRVGMPDHAAHFLEFDARHRRVVVAVLRQERQSGGEFVRLLKAVGGALRHQLLDNARHGRRDVAAQVGEGGRFVPALFVELGKETAAGERDLAGQQEIKGTAQAVKVGSYIGPVRIFELLGRDVIRSADDRAPLRDRAERIPRRLAAKLENAAPLPCRAISLQKYCLAPDLRPLTSDL